MATEGIKILKRKQAEEILNLTYNPDVYQELVDRFSVLEGMRSLKIEDKWVYFFFKSSEIKNEHTRKSLALKSYMSYFSEKIVHKDIVGAYTDDYIFIFNMKDAEKFYMFFENQKLGEAFIQQRAEKARKGEDELVLFKLYND